MDCYGEAARGSLGFSAVIRGTQAAMTCHDRASVERQEVLVLPMSQPAC
jgi:hypothetical protein